MYVLFIVLQCALMLFDVDLPSLCLTFGLSMRKSDEVGKRASTCMSSRDVSSLVSPSHSMRHSTHLLVSSLRQRQGHLALDEETRARHEGATDGCRE